MEQKPKRRGRPPKGEQLTKATKPTKKPKQEPTKVIEEDFEPIIVEDDGDEFLANLNNENYGKEQTEYYDDEPLMAGDEHEEETTATESYDSEYYDINKPISPETEMLFQNVIESKKRGRKPKQVGFQTSCQDDTSSDLFSSKGSQILGRTKRELAAKLKQYRQLFPEELKIQSQERRERRRTTGIFRRNGSYCFRLKC